MEILPEALWIYMKKRSERKELSYRGMFDLPDGHHMALTNMTGLDKRGNQIFPAPCIVHEMEKIRVDMDSVTDLLNAVNDYARKAFAEIEIRKGKFWESLAKDLGVDLSKVGMRFDHGGGVSLVEKEPDGHKETER